ncbi:MAG: DUF167 domain-containing protein [Candidatus Yanofskybacteria bacterium]|nr:DUF167 domain-containing protein [Candidatus Yanofskybacteria bacterium]
MTRITVRAHPKAKQARMQQLGPSEYGIWVTEAPERGKATAAIRRALAQHLHIAPSRVSLVMGDASRTKVFEIR